MTQDYIRDMLETSVGDPLAMSERLRLTMSDAQKETIERAARASGRVDLSDDPAGDQMRAVLVTAFWRTLRMRGNRTIVLAPTEDARRAVASFLRSIAAQDPAMQNVTSWPRWYKMLFGRHDGWQIDIPTAKAEFIGGAFSETSLTVVALQDSYSTEFEDAIRAGEGLCSGEHDLFIQLWQPSE